MRCSIHVLTLAGLALLVAVGPAAPTAAQESGPKPRVLFVPAPTVPPSLRQGVPRLLRSRAYMVSSEAYVSAARARGLRPSNDRAISLVATRRGADLIVVARFRARGRSRVLHLTYHDGRTGDVLGAASARLRGLRMGGSAQHAVLRGLEAAAARTSAGGPEPDARLARAGTAGRATDSREAEARRAAEAREQAEARRETEAREQAEARREEERRESERREEARRESERERMAVRDEDSRRSAAERRLEEEIRRALERRTREDRREEERQLQAERRLEQERRVEARRESERRSAAARRDVASRADRARRAAAERRDALRRRRAGRGADLPPPVDWEDRAEEQEEEDLDAEEDEAGDEEEEEEDAARDDRYAFDASAAFGFGLRSATVPIEAGSARLSTSPFPAGGVGLGVSMRVTDDELARAGVRAEYLTSLGLQTRETAPDGSTKTVDARSQRVAFGARAEIRLAQSERAAVLSIDAGWSFRMLSTETALGLPEYTLSGPFARVGIRLPVGSGPLRVGLAPEVAAVTGASDVLEQGGGVSTGVAFGGEASVSVVLSRAIELSLQYREVHAVLGSDTGTDLADIERWGMFGAVYRP